MRPTASIVQQWPKARTRSAVIRPNSSGMSGSSREALTAAGIPFDLRLLAPTGQFGRADGEQAMHHLLSLDVPPDALLAYNDLTAIGALRALTRAHVRVPADVAVAGIDDIEEGRFSNPTLTTVAPDKREIGRLAVRRLVARIEGDGGPPTHVQPAFNLVERESAGSAR